MALCLTFGWRVRLILRTAAVVPLPPCCCRVAPPHCATPPLPWITTTRIEVVAARPRGGKPPFPLPHPLPHAAPPRIRLIPSTPIWRPACQTAPSPAFMRGRMPILPCQRPDTGSGPHPRAPLILPAVLMRIIRRRLPSRLPEKDTDSSRKQSSFVPFAILPIKR